MDKYKQLQPGRFQVGDRPSSAAAGVAAVAFFGAAIVVAVLALWPGDPYPTINENGVRMERPVQKAPVTPTPPQ